MKKNIITLICIGLVADGKGKRTLLTGIILSTLSSRELVV